MKIRIENTILGDDLHPQPPIHLSYERKKNMPTFTLDDSAHKILRQVRDKLKAAGQGADLSDAVRYLNEHQEKDEYSGWADK